MKVIVKYEIKDSQNLNYGMFENMTDMIPNLLIKDREVPLGGTASNLSWLEQDVHRATDEIKKRFNVDDVEYVLFSVPINQWQQLSVALPITLVQTLFSLLSSIYIVFWIYRRYKKNINPFDNKK